MSRRPITQIRLGTEQALRRENLKAALVVARDIDCLYVMHRRLPRQAIVHHNVLWVVTRRMYFILKLRCVTSFIIFHLS